MKYTPTKPWIFMGALLIAVAVTPFISSATVISDQLDLFHFFQATSSPAFVFNPTYTAPAGGPQIKHLDISPAITVQSGNPLISDIYVGGLIDQKAQPILYTINTVRSEKIFSSSVNGIAPTLPDTFFDNYTVDYSAPGGSATTQYLPISVLMFGNVGTHNGASLTTGPVVGAASKQTLYAQGKGSYYYTPLRAGFEVDDFVKNETGGGRVQVDINSGIFIKPLVSGTENRDYYSQGATAAMVHVGPARFGSDGYPRGGSVLDIDGGISVKRVGVNDTNYTALLSDYLIAYTNLTAARTVTLPSAAQAGSGKVYIIKDESGNATNVISISVNSADGIDGKPSKKITTNYNTLQVYSNGTAWFSL